MMHSLTGDNTMLYSLTGGTMLHSPGAYTEIVFGGGGGGGGQMLILR